MCTFIIETFYITYISYFFCNPYRSVVIGVIGSLLLNNVDWSSVFYCIGIAGFFWIFLWKLLLLGNSDLEHVEMKDVDELTTSRNKLLSVPWTDILFHPPLW